jgi:hypothetical protein
MAEPNENIECGLTADLTGDCKVGPEDLALLMSEWLVDPAAPITWEATMDTDPVLSGDWVLRDPSFNHYSISGGKMILDGQTAVVDASPAMDLNNPLDIWVTFRATQVTPSPTLTDAEAPSVWANMDTDQAAHANLRLSIYKVSSTEQKLAVVSNNLDLLASFGGLGTGMINVHARIVPNGTTGGTITLDVTDGVTSYTNQTYAYSNNVPGQTPHRYVTMSSLGLPGEIDYIKAQTTQAPLYNLAGDPTIDLEDFAVMASEWLLKYVWVPIVP